VEGHRPKSLSPDAEKMLLSHQVHGKNSSNQDHGDAQVVFKSGIDMSVRFLGFSQRRYVGFRKHFEFDKKRILLASEHSLKILGY